MLDLIRKQQIDIKDIPIATITAQYLEYLEKAREMDIDLGAEFVYMAATLIHIKSKMLLPRDPALEKEGEDAEDPRQELVERLLEHERFKNAAEMLQQKRLIEENVWSNPQLKAFISESDDPGLSVTLFDLVKALGAMIERAKHRPVYEVDTPLHHRPVSGRSGDGADAGRSIDTEGLIRRDRAPTARQFRRRVQVRPAHLGDRKRLHLRQA